MKFTPFILHELLNTLHASEPPAENGRNSYTTMTASHQAFRIVAWSSSFRFGRKEEFMAALEEDEEQDIFNAPPSFHTLRTTTPHTTPTRINATMHGSSNEQPREWKMQPKRVRLPFATSPMRMACCALVNLAPHSFPHTR